MMISFYKFKLCECKNNYIPIYHKNNIETISYKIKEYGRENLNTRFFSDLTQPDLCPLSFNFCPKLEVPLIQGFQTKPSSNTIGL